MMHVIHLSTYILLSLYNRLRNGNDDVIWKGMQQQWRQHQRERWKKKDAPKHRYAKYLLFAVLLFSPLLPVLRYLLLSLRPQFEQSESLPSLMLMHDKSTCMCYLDKFLPSPPCQSYFTHKISLPFTSRPILSLHLFHLIVHFAAHFPPWMYTNIISSRLQIYIASQTELPLNQGFFISFRRSGIISISTCLPTITSIRLEHRQIALRLRCDVKTIPQFNPLHLPMYLQLRTTDLSMSESFQQLGLCLRCNMKTIPQINPLQLFA